MKHSLLSAAILLTPFVIFSQNVGIGTTAPEMKLHIAKDDSAVVVIENTQSLNTNVSNALYFKTGDGPTPYTDALKTIGQTFNEARIGLFTYTDASPNGLLERLSITDAGNIGVGITNPNFKLHITDGDLFVNAATGSIKLGNDQSNQWRFTTTVGGANLRMESATDGSNFISHHYFNQSGTVGIGTGNVSPGAQLHVASEGSNVIRMNGNYPFLTVYDNTLGYKGFLGFNGSDMVLGGVSTPIRFSSSGNRMAINPDGRIVMGSSNNPAVGYLLSINGKAICEELKVQLSPNWPDYVFNSDYKLMPLEDLEKLINKYKHLPNIPSAAEISADKGFEVGEMNRKLLEKVEELTLYIIDLNKKNTQLSKELDEIKIQLNKISNK